MNTAIEIVTSFKGVALVAVTGLAACLSIAAVVLVFDFIEFWRRRIE